MSEQKSIGEEQLHRALFSSLVSMLSATALQQLGKLVNPLTNKTEVNLEGAQITIDMLAMLEAKTRGNLASDEERMLKNTLATLRLNYVEVVESTPAAQAQQHGAQAAGAAASPDASAAREQTQPEAQKSEEKEPRFRKSYGTG